MGSALIVINPPCFDLRFRICERRDLVHVQAFITQPAVTRFDVSVFHGLGDGDGRGEFPDVAVYMSIGQGARAWAAYPALSAPLAMMEVERRWFLLSATIGMMEVERRWFLLSATIGMAMWNAINSIVIGARTFCILYAVGWWAWRVDPHMLTILRESVRFKTRYDPAKWAEQPWYILITPARRLTRL